MMITFSGGLERILNETKTMTTRLDAKGHYREAWAKGQDMERDIVLDLWWLNPRNRHPDCYKIGRVYWEREDEVRGHALTPEDALLDGFDTLLEYKVALMNLNNMRSIREVDSHVWTQIIWSKEDGYVHWADGPHRPRPRRVA